MNMHITQQIDENLGHVLDQDEIRSLMINFLKTRGALGATAEEMDKVLQWAQQAKVEWIFVEQVKSGEFGVDVDGTGEIAFCRRGKLPQC